MRKDLVIEQLRVPAGNRGSLVRVKSGADEFEYVNDLQAGTVLRVRGVLDTATIKSLNTTPVAIIAAPGANLMAAPLFGGGKYVFNTAAFTSTQLRMRYAGEMFNIQSVSPCFNVLANKVWAENTSFEAGDDAPVNKAVELSADADSAVGDGSLIYEVHYVILDFS